MWSNRRVQSMEPSTVEPGSTTLSQVWKITPSFSWTSVTVTPPKTPWSAGWPPPSG